MPKNRGLGRGLDSIFADNSVETGDDSGRKYRNISITCIDVNPDQPRKNFNEESLKILAESIRENGLIEPLAVRKTSEIPERYEIIAGERRFRACVMLGMAEVPVNVIEADDIAAAKLTLIENLQREDLTPIEEANAYRLLMDKCYMTQEELSKAVGVSRSVIANAVRLLELPDDIKKYVEENPLFTSGHARALLSLEDRGKMVEIADRCIAGEWSVRVTEDEVKKANLRKAAEELPEEEEKPLKVDYNKVLAEKFTGLTGRRCKIVNTKKNKTFQIEFHDNADLEYLLQLLAGDDIFKDY